MSKELIQALKNNEKSFGLMSKEMRIEAKKIGHEAFDCFLGSIELPWQDAQGLLDYRTYRLRPDYTEEPEVVECEEWPIFQKWGTLRYARHLADRDEVGTNIDIAVRQINFIGFKYEDGKLNTEPRMYKHKEHGTYLNMLNVEYFETNEYEVLAPTAVLFRKEQK